jgi:hypothetical protein
MVLPGRLHYQLLPFHLKVVIDGPVYTLLQAPGLFLLSMQQRRRDQKD